MGPNYSLRQGILRKSIEKNNLDAVVISGRNDIYYYSGYLGFGDDAAFLIVPSNGSPLLMVSPLSNEAELHFKNTKFFSSLKDVKKEVGFRKVGYDGKNMASVLFKKLSRGGKWTDFSDEIKKPRQVKDHWEVSNIRKAQQVTKRIVRNLPDLAGMTEEGVASLIDMEFRKRNLPNAFGTIVSSGPQGAFIHHIPNSRKIRRDDMVIIDLGCRVAGYCSDHSRTFHEGNGKKERKILSDVKQIQKELMDHIRPGVQVKDIGTLQGKLFKRFGYKVRHAFGHGVGLSVHEGLGKTFEKNNVVTVEPGVYIDKFGGCRIEDMFLVTSKAKML